MQKIWIVHGLRFLAFFFSIFAFICHSIQCALLKTYQSKVIIIIMIINAVTNNNNNNKHIDWHSRLVISRPLAGKIAIL